MRTNTMRTNTLFVCADKRSKEFSMFRLIEANKTELQEYKTDYFKKTNGDRFFFITVRQLDTYRGYHIDVMRVEQKLHLTHTQKTKLDRLSRQVNSRLQK